MFQTDYRLRQRNCETEGVIDPRDRQQLTEDLASNIVDRRQGAFLARHVSAQLHQLKLDHVASRQEEGGQNQCHRQSSSPRW